MHNIIDTAILRSTGDSFFLLCNKMSLSIVFVKANFNPTETQNVYRHLFVVYLFGGEHFDLSTETSKNL